MLLHMMALNQDNDFPIETYRYQHNIVFQLIVSFAKLKQKKKTISKLLR